MDPKSVMVIGGPRVPVEEGLAILAMSGIRPTYGPDNPIERHLAAARSDIAVPSTRTQQFTDIGKNPTSSGSATLPKETVASSVYTRRPASGPMRPVQGQLYPPTYESSSGYATLPQRPPHLSTIPESHLTRSMRTQPSEYVSIHQGSLR